MSFLHPYFLWALLLIAIPVIIHLFNFRIHKTVYFSDIRFLENIKNVSESKSKLKNIIILLLRILTVAMLVVAFSRPYIPLRNKQKSEIESIVVLYLDNTYSMNVESIHGNLFNAAKERARTLVNSYDNKQKFLFLSNDLQPKHKIITTKQQVLNFISDCELAPTSRSLSGILSNAEQYIDDLSSEIKPPIIYYIVSDFQKNVSDLSNLNVDSSELLNLLPLATNQVNNIYIDSVWFSSPGRNLNKQEELKVRVINKGSEDYQEIPIKLFINGKQKVISNFEIEANSIKTISVMYTNTETGILPAYLEITDYPITYDNQFFFSYHITKKKSILLINQSVENKYFNALFKDNDSFNLKNSFEGNVRTSEFANYDLIILDEIKSLSSGLVQELKQFVSNGGVLLVVPGFETNVKELNNMLLQLQSETMNSDNIFSTKIKKINFEHFIYKDVFLKKQDRLNLPDIKKCFTLNASQGNTRVLLNSLDEKPLLLHNNFGNGKIYVFAFPLKAENSDFVQHPLFVPTIYNIATFTDFDEKLYYIIGEEQIIDIKIPQKEKDEVFQVVNSDMQVGFIPLVAGVGEIGVRFNLMNNISKAENYYIKSKTDTLKSISYNYDRIESEPAFYTNSELDSIIGDRQLENINILSANLEQLKSRIEESLKDRKDVWKWFVFLALAFIIGEILVIKLWKEN